MTNYIYYPKVKKEQSQEDRISLIRNAYIGSTSLVSKKSVSDFVEDVKSEEFFSEHGLIDNQKVDVEDEAQFLNSDSAEDIDEEDQQIGLSDAMKESAGISTEREYNQEVVV